MEVGTILGTILNYKRDLCVHCSGISLRLTVAYMGIMSGHMELL